MSSPRMAVIMALVFALSPLAIDMYLPAFPAIAADLSVDSRDIAITISLYFFGFGIGQFFGGPLSDYLGRRPVLFLGLAVFSLASVTLATTSNIDVFWGARFVQALGGGFSVVVVPAMIRDHTEGSEAAKLFALIGLITIIAPGIAPALGTFFYTLSGWRAIFLALVGYAVIVGALTWRFLHVQPRTPPRGVPESLLTRYRFVLGNTIAMRYLLAQGLALGIMMTFLANASLVYIETYGASETGFSALFACNVVAMAIFNRFNHWLLNYLPPARILIPVLGLQAVAAVALVTITGFDPPLWAVVSLVVLAVGPLSCVMGNSMTSVLQFFPYHSGIAAALMGSGQYLIGALVSGLSTQFQSAQMWPMSVTMASAALLAILIVPSERAFNAHLERMGVEA